ncbi:anti-sigma factor [Kribbella sp. CA-253562]|uniref:anti-sigma factor n=1 Tax=Kribbella sp. CA-253562 TaxID=3239942 RepID=UPI003D908562
MPTPDVHMLTGPYVLNALPEDERIGFEAHLADCPSCTAEVAELREAATKLSTAVAVPPPPALKARVLSEIAMTRQLPPILREAGVDTSPSSGAAPAPPPASGDATPIAPPASGDATRVAPHAPGDATPVAPPASGDKRRTRRSFFGLAAAALAVAGAGGIAVEQYRDNQRAERQNEELAALLSQPDAKTARGEVAGGGQATVVMSAGQDRAIVLLRGLAKLPDGKTYQLWLQDRSEVMHSAGIAAPNDSKLIQGGITDKVALGITVENTPGVPAPTQPPAALVPMV